MTEALTTTQPTIMTAGEVATSAEAAQAVAIVQSRYVMARSRARNLEQVRVSLLEECRRPGFAESAMYHLPIGKDGVEGPSIRFAEAAFRCMGNIWQHAMVTYDDADKRILSVMVTDLENNVTFEDSITITKTVERRHLKKNQEPKGTRLNSYGDTLYIVEASEGELRAKQGAEVSKSTRTLGLRHLPGDIREGAIAVVKETVQKDVTDNPQDALRRLIDGFAAIGVEPEHLVTFLRHSIKQTTPTEIVKLRGIYSAMKEGLTTWNEVVMNAGVPTETKTSRTAETLKAKRAEKKDTKPPPKQEDPPPADPGYGPPPMTDEQAAQAEEATKGEAPGEADF
jgi:hypothetical protein